MAQNCTDSVRRKGLCRAPSAEQIERAAQMCYSDRRNDEEKARELGVCRRTLVRWKNRPDFHVAYDVAHRKHINAMAAQQRAECARRLNDFQATPRVSRKR